MKKTDIIETKSGKIQGCIEDELGIFKGIPYAEAPLGELRFSPPVAKKSWDDVLETTAYGPCAYQGYSQLEEFLGKPEPESEDCLSLNIWTPATDGKKRPVMVWIHGGAFMIGTGKDPMYDGSALARRGDVVVVTINYRLGTFGFLYLKGKTINVGSLDQILALKWVNENIEKFGGDPENVTIFGESAGGYSVIALCTMPTAKGLFKRIIAQSAPFIDVHVSEKISKKILRKLNIKGGNLDALREVAPETIIDAQNKVFEADPVNIMALRPLITGDIFPIHPLKAFKKGDCANIDLMIGTNLEEFKLFAAMEPLKTMVEAGAEKLLIGYLGMVSGINADTSNEIISTYKEAREGIESLDLFNALVTDFAFRISSIRLLEAQSVHQPNVYNYLFTWPSPGLDGILGSCHSLEIPFVFGTLDAPTLKDFVKGAPEDLSGKMMDAWIAFARTGNPNHDALPEWAAYDSEARATMFLGDECKLVNAAFDKERAAWDGLLEIK